jgi:hypothetical protein
MTSIVFVIYDKSVLIATGAKWLLDDKQGGEALKIAEDQRSYKSTKEEALAEIQQKLPPNCLIRLPLDKKVDSKGAQYYTTRFVDKSKPNPPGFIKGEIKPAKGGTPKETPKAAAAREFEEETFTKIDQGRFLEVSLGSGVFKLVLTDKNEADTILANWRKNFNAGLGELVNLEWVSVADIKANKVNLNDASKGAMVYFNRMRFGGRRKQTLRSRRMLKKPKTLKKRIR